MGEARNKTGQGKKFLAKPRRLGPERIRERDTLKKCTMIRKNYGAVISG